MVGLVPSLKLYSLNPYETPINTRNSGLTNATTFNVNINNPNTNTAINYSINDATTTANQNYNTYYTIDSTNGGLAANAATALRNYTQALWLNPNPSFGAQSISNTSVKSIDQIPDSIDAFNKRLASFSLHADNFDTLKNAGDFSIANGTMATLVETDGFGNITNTKLGQNIQSASPQLFATADNFNFANRQAILASAFKRVSVNSPTIADQIQQRLNTIPPGGLNAGLNGLPDVFQQQLRTIQKFARNGVDFGITPERLGLNDNRFASTTQPLFQPIPSPENNGFPQANSLLSTLDNSAAQKAATVQANWQVQLSNETQKNIQMLQQNQMKQGAIYQSMSMDRILDGHIPTMPYGVPNPNPDRSLAFTGGSLADADAGLALAGLEATGDAASKRGAGGYLPFSMDSGSSFSQGQSGLMGQPQRGSMAFQGGDNTGEFTGQNPFAGGSSGSGFGGFSQELPQPKPRKPLNLTA